MSDRSTRLEAKAASAVREIYRPVLRGYFAVFALYYVVMTPINFLTLDGFEMVSLVMANLRCCSMMF